MKSRTTKLGLIGLGLFLLLGGPTPGSVGDCSAGDSFANPVDHCQQKEAWTCARRGARGDLASDAEVMACTSRITATCAGANWPVGCAPTEQESEACIAAMQDRTTLGERGTCFPDSLSCGTPPMIGPMCAACDQPPECNLCGATGALTSTDDASDAGEAGGGE